MIMENNPNTKHDFFLVSTKNKNTTLGQFEEAGINTSTSRLQDRDYYKNNDKIKEMYVKPDGSFDEKTFEEDYNMALYRYNKIADGDTYIPPVFSKYDTRAYDSKISNKIVTDFNRSDYKIIKNPAANIYSVHEVEGISEGSKSIRELAQANKVYNTKKGKFEDYTANEWGKFGFGFLKNFLGDNLVLETWDSDGYHEDPHTKDLVAHTKGEYKLDKNYRPYYSTLDGRDVSGKDVLSSWDVIVDDDSWLSQYAFWEGDDKEKHWLGSITKNAVKAGLYFVPYLNYAVIAKDIAELTTNITALTYGGITGTTPALLNNMKASFSGISMDSSSDYARNHMFSFENIAGLTGDVFSQLAGQRLIFKPFQKLAEKKAASMANKVISKYGDDIVEETLTGEKLLAKLPHYKGLESNTYTFLNINGQLIPGSKATLTETVKRLENIQNTINVYSKAGERASKAFMVGVSGSDAYWTAKENGWDDRSAALAGISTLGMYGLIMQLPVAQWIYPHKELNDVVARKVINSVVADQGLRQVAKEAVKEAAEKGTTKGVSKFQKLFNNKVFNTFRKTKESVNVLQKGSKYIDKINNSYNQLNNVLSFSLKSIKNDAINEALEEISETVGEDIVWELTALATNKKSLAAWRSPEGFSTYILSGLGGALGGTIGSMSGVKNLGRLATTLFDDSKAMENMIVQIQNGNAEQLKQAIEDMHKNKALGRADLSMEIDEKASTEEEIIYKAATKGVKTQNDVVRDILLRQIEVYESIMSTEGLDISDEEVINKLLAKDQQITVMLGNSKDKLQNAILTDFRELSKEIVKTKVELEALSGQGLTDLEERRQKDKKVDLKVIELENRLAELQQRKEALLNSEQSKLDYLEKALYSIHTNLHNSSDSLTFKSYLKNVRHLDVEKLEEEDYALFVQDYYEFISEGKYRDNLYASYKAFKDLNDSSSLSLMSIVNSESFTTNKQQHSELFTSLTKSIEDNPELFDTEEGKKIIANSNSAEGFFSLLNFLNKHKGNEQALNVEKIIYDNIFNILNNLEGKQLTIETASLLYSFKKYIENKAFDNFRDVSRVFNTLLNSEESIDNLSEADRITLYNFIKNYNPYLEEKDLKVALDYLLKMSKLLDNTLGIVVGDVLNINSNLQHYVGTKNYLTPDIGYRPLSPDYGDVPAEGTEGIEELLPFLGISEDVSTIPVGFFYNNKTAALLKFIIASKNNSPEKFNKTLNDVKKSFTYADGFSLINEDTAIDALSQEYLDALQRIGNLVTETNITDPLDEFITQNSLLPDKNLTTILNNLHTLIRDLKGDFSKLEFDPELENQLVEILGVLDSAKRVIMASMYRANEKGDIIWGFNSDLNKLHKNQERGEISVEDGLILLNSITNKANQINFFLQQNSVNKTKLLSEAPRAEFATYRAQGKALIDILNKLSVSIDEGILDYFSEDFDINKDISEEEFTTLHTNVRILEETLRKVLLKDPINTDKDLLALKDKIFSIFKEGVTYTEEFLESIESSEISQMSSALDSFTPYEKVMLVANVLSRPLEDEGKLHANHMKDKKPLSDQYNIITSAVSFINDSLNVNGVSLYDLIFQEFESLSDTPTLDLSRIMFINSPAASGKTSVIFKTTADYITEKFGKNAVIITGSEAHSKALRETNPEATYKSIEDLLNSFEFKGKLAFTIKGYLENIDKLDPVTKSTLLKLLNKELNLDPESPNLLEDFINLEKTYNKEDFEAAVEVITEALAYINGYESLEVTPKEDSKLDFANSKAIFIDEATFHDHIILQKLNAIAKKYNLKIVTLGDAQQSGATSINLGNMPFSGNPIFQTSRLATNFRTGSINIRQTLKSLETVYEVLLKSIKETKGNYFLDGIKDFSSIIHNISFVYNPTQVDGVHLSTNEDDSMAELFKGLDLERERGNNKVTLAIVSKHKSEADRITKNIQQHVKDKNTSENTKLEVEINYFTEEEVQGKEFDYLYVDMQGLTLGLDTYQAQFTLYKRLNTIITRSKKAVFIQGGRTNTLSSKESDNYSFSSLPKEIIDRTKFSFNNRVNALNNVLSTNNSAPIKTVKVEQETKPEKEKEEEIMLPAGVESEEDENTPEQEKDLEPTYVPTEEVVVPPTTQKEVVNSQNIVEGFMFDTNILFSGLSEEYTSILLSDKALTEEELSILTGEKSKGTVFDFLSYIKLISGLYKDTKKMMVSPDSRRDIIKSYTKFVNTIQEHVTSRRPLKELVVKLNGLLPNANLTEENLMGFVTNGINSTNTGFLNTFNTPDKAAHFTNSLGITIKIGSEELNIRLGKFNYYKRYTEGDMSDKVEDSTKEALQKIFDKSGGGTEEFILIPIEVFEKGLVDDNSNGRPFISTPEIQGSSLKVITTLSDLKRDSKKFVIGDKIYAINLKYLDSDPTISKEVKEYIKSFFKGDYKDKQIYVTLFSTDLSLKPSDLYNKLLSPSSDQSKKVGIMILETSESNVYKTLYEGDANTIGSAAWLFSNTSKIENIPLLYDKNETMTDLLIYGCIMAAREEDTLWKELIHRMGNLNFVGNVFTNSFFIQQLKEKLKDNTKTVKELVEEIKADVNDSLGFKAFLANEFLTTSKGKRRAKNQFYSFLLFKSIKEMYNQNVASVKEVQNMIKEFAEVMGHDSAVMRYYPYVDSTSKTTYSQSMFPVRIDPSLVKLHGVMQSRSIFVDSNTISTIASALDELRNPSSTQTPTQPKTQEKESSQSKILENNITFDIGNGQTATVTINQSTPTSDITIEVETPEGKKFNIIATDKEKNILNDLEPYVKSFLKYPDRMEDINPSSVKVVKTNSSYYLDVQGIGGSAKVYKNKVSFKLNEKEPNIENTQNTEQVNTVEIPSHYEETMGKPMYKGLIRNINFKGFNILNKDSTSFEKDKKAYLDRIEEYMSKLNDQQKDTLAPYIEVLIYEINNGIFKNNICG